MKCFMKCWKCGKEIKDGEEYTFSSEWDAFCHVKCCPAYNPKAKVTKECELCEQYRLKVVKYGRE